MDRDPVVQQTPMEEWSERWSEGTGLHTATMAVALENHRQMLADHRRRTCEANKAMARAAGMEDIVGDCSEDDQMGDITVTGDQHYHFSGETKSQPQAPAQTELSLPKWVKPALLSAALGGPLLGAAGGYLAAGPSPETTPPTVVDTDTDRWTEFGIDKETTE